MNRIKGVKGISIAVVASAAVLLSSHLWVKSVESRKWSDMEKTARDLEAEAVARPSVRPVLRGKAVPGNAIEFYERAHSQLSEKPSTALLAFVADASAENRGKALEYLDQHPEVLAVFREATTREDSRLQVDWAARELRLPQGKVSAIVRCKSRLLAAEGRQREAADLLLDLIQMGQDLERHAEIFEFFGRSIQIRAVDDLRLLMASPDLGRDDLMEISRGLDLLDRSFPELGPLILNSAMRLGFLMLNSGTLDQFLLELEWKHRRPVPWRSGFSERLMMVELFERQYTDSRRVAEGDRLPWREARAITEPIDRDRATFKNPIFVKRFSDSFLPIQAIYRESRARRRLLRMAAHYRATGEVLTLEDPLGTTLRFAEEKGRVRFWSVGQDGVDDGGMGAWEAKGKDIVLEMKR